MPAECQIIAYHRSSLDATQLYPSHMVLMRSWSALFKLLVRREPRGAYKGRLL